MGWGQSSGNGEDDEPGSDPVASFDRAAAPLLAGFASGGHWDQCPPSAALAAALEAASGPEWRSPGATNDDLTGLLGRWAALEAWATAGKLGIIRAMMRQESEPWQSVKRHGDLPDQWSDSLNHEVALALGISVQTAEAAALLAWDLQARLPGIGAKLADGTLSYLKVMLISKELSVLGEEDAVQAEALVLDRLAQTPDLTPGQLARAAAQAAVSIDPEGAQRRREAAEKLDVRVRLWREQSGAAALEGRNLPPDEALAAYASVNARAAEYKKSGAFPGAFMEEFRAMAYLDLLSGETTVGRIAKAEAKAADGQQARPADAGSRRDEGPDEEGPDGTGPNGTGPSGSGPSGSGPDGDGPSGGGPTFPGDLPGAGSESDASPGGSASTRLTDLVIPLLTLLGLAERPGEAHGLGPLDPALCRNLAAAAANSPRSEWCLTITDENGFAIGHGCARVGRGDKAALKVTGIQPARGTALPSKVNLTVPVTALHGLGAEASGWRFTPLDGTGMPGGEGPPRGRIRAQDGYGTWSFTLPGGRTLTVRVDPVPTYTCDHGNESHAYQPNDTLRHLVQVRDGECTFPRCSRHARETDFEHAIPYHKGGRTCACNAGARSRKCHRVKQSPGWTVSQPKPGWHQWTTPSGRSYTQEPKRYPA